MRATHEHDLAVDDDDRADADDRPVRIASLQCALP
jgi:hypothetical protein